MDLPGRGTEGRVRPRELLPQEPVEQVRGRHPAAQKTAGCLRRFPGERRAEFVHRLGPPVAPPPGLTRKVEKDPARVRKWNTAQGHMDSRVRGDTVKLLGLAVQPPLDGLA